MSDLTGAAAQAVDQPQGDVIAILLEQHQRIRELFTDVKGAGEHKQQAFDELRALLAAHETAEEMVLRPVSSKDTGAAIAEARNQEENQATRLLTELEKMDVSSAEFDRAFAEFELAVLDHAGHEEREEFPRCAPKRTGTGWSLWGRRYGQRRRLRRPTRIHRPRARLPRSGRWGRSRRSLTAPGTRSRTPCRAADRQPATRTWRPGSNGAVRSCPTPPRVVR